MSSLPTSDGCNHPVHPSGQSPETGNPTSLARSVSASVCPIKPSDPGSIEPKAVKALKASAEFQITSKKRELLPLQDLSDSASSADNVLAHQSPAMPLQNSSKEAVVSDNLKKFPAEKSTQDPKFHLYTRWEASLSITTTTIHGSQMFPGENGQHSEYQNQSQVNGLQQHNEPGNEQRDVAQLNAPCDREHLCNIGDLELLGESQQNQQKNVDLEAEMKGDRLRQNVDLAGIEKNNLPSGCFGCSNSETFMEVDVVEQSLDAGLNSVGSQNAKVNIGAAELTLDNPLMEIEASKCDPSSESLSNSVSTQDLQLPESNIEMSGTNKKYGNCSPSLSLCGSCQPSVESAEESCSSITAALKELHELLVVSNKPGSENISEEVLCQSETVAEGQPVVKDLSERWIQTEHLITTQNEQGPQVSLHQAVHVSVKTEKLTGTSPGAGIEDTENINYRGTGDGMSADKEDVPKSRESITESSSVTVSSAKMSSQLHCRLSAEISPRLSAGEEDALSQTSEQTKSLPSSFILVKDLSQGIQNPITDRPVTRENVCPEVARSFLEFEPPISHLSSNPSILQPLIFPAADIDRILRAGFTLQEALGALHRVGGNADLALLVLLAKNIVVPT
ncbi:regulatory solute carrier protein family 1 member 1 [Tamandua tetradactyla]|uniref:regulatory solute carrier protein family 1 member 1 n=1 Tax=Tamandua tetradactyla TaxID=48850 RepID=UPI004053C938